MEYKIIRNFVSREEQADLIHWIINNKNSSWLFKDANMKGNRVTTRYSKDFSFPEAAGVVRGGNRGKRVSAP